MTLATKPAARTAAPAVKVLESGEWPTTMKAVVDDIVSRMSARDRQRVRRMQKHNLFKFHRTWGMAIRNYYGLWRGNEKLVRAACFGGYEPEDASMYIIEAVWKRLQASGKRPAGRTRTRR